MYSTLDFSRTLVRYGLPPRAVAWLCHGCYAATLPDGSELRWYAPDVWARDAGGDWLALVGDGAVARYGADPVAALAAARGAL